MQSFPRAFAEHWRWIALFFIALVPRLYLLRVYDIELSQDGFDAVNLITIIQTQGIAAASNEGITRFVLHPLYSVLLYTWRVITPASIDFYFAARFLSALIGCVAVLVLFEFTRRAFSEIAAWMAALFLAFAPSFLWESVAILSSTTFLVLYIAVLLALLQSHYRLAAFLAFLSAITRTEGSALCALVLIALLWRDLRERKFQLADWFVCLVFTLAVPLTIVGSSWLATGNALAFVGAQSISSIWLHFLAPGDFFKRGAFFVTQYPALFPAPIVWLGAAGVIVALIWHRAHATAMLLLTSALYLLFFEGLVWFNYTTLETRFLMYPGLPLLVFAGVALADAHKIAAKSSRPTANAGLAALVVILSILSYQQGDAGIRFMYNMMASQREMADELARILSVAKVPPNQKTNLLAYTGNAGALDLFGRRLGLEFTFTDFRFAPDENPEQFLIDRKIQFVVYPVGNAFAKAKYPYLARFETQTHGAVTFKPITQFATFTDNQLYSIWSVSY